MKQLVKLWKRPSLDGEKFKYYLLYTDEQGKRKQKSLGHSDRRKAERQRAQLEHEFRAGVVGPDSMRLREFMERSLATTGNQIRLSTQIEYRSAMEDWKSACKRDPRRRRIWTHLRHTIHPYTRPSKGSLFG
jgi:hypothetical protein